MTIVAAHELNKASTEVIAAAAAEAVRKGQRLVVLHVVTAVDLDSAEALTSGIEEFVDSVIAKRGLTGVEREVRLVASTSSGVDDTAEAILSEAEAVDASIIVVGARRRSKVGKVFLGSVTQDILLEAPVPVLVVKQRSKRR